MDADNQAPPSMPSPPAPTVSLTPTGKATGTADPFRVERVCCALSQASLRR
jgi:hypothetical protein